MSEKLWKPMLAAEFDEAAIRNHFEKEGPLLASPKLDGIRCIGIDDKLKTRSMKLVPSLVLQERFSRYQGYDGELIAGLPNSPTVYNDTYSAVMKKIGPSKGNNGEPIDVTFWVFDHVAEPDAPYVQRIAKIDNAPGVKFLPQKMIYSWDELIVMETDLLAQGYEGVMLRSPKGMYKNGRSTHREMYLCKVKRDTDAVAEIVDIYPAMHNTNEAFDNELGHTTRSTDAEGLVATDRAGGFLIEYNGMQFRCGMGKFTHDEAKKILENKNRYIGNMLLEFKYFGYGNVKAGQPGAPRHPRGVKFRSRLDT